MAALANGGAGPLFKQLREQYDFVIIDSSPILPVADTRFVSQHADTVVLSVFRDRQRSAEDPGRVRDPRRLRRPRPGSGGHRRQRASPTAGGGSTRPAATS